jgi:hypothetical protein
LAVGDSSLCNRILLRQPLDRIDILSRRFYSTGSFTPDQIRHRESLAWQQTPIFHGGQWRRVLYKEVASVYWRSAGGKRPLRLLVVAPYLMKAAARLSGGPIQALRQTKKQRNLMESRHLPVV